MSIKLLVSGLVLLVSFNALALNMGQEFHRQSLLMKRSPLKLRADGSLQTQETMLFDQKLDHSDADSKTFKQRVFIDSHYAEGDHSPVFYVICGEWNCAGTSSYSFVENLALKFKAHLVALEHRYYGESLPTKTLTSEALSFLNIESAIEDLATVQRYLMSTRNLNGKWFSFGGSYAGTLSAFYREKHPELVTGALASSAPVHMKNEFTEYDAHIAKVINKSVCGDSVREAVKLIEEKLTTPEGEKEVKELFESTELKNNRDFLYVVADMLAAAVQYGRDQIFCNALLEEDDLVKGYAKAGLIVLDAMGSTPYGDSLAVAERIEVTPDDNMRQWMWQSCRQFGWFQVANGTGKDSARSSQIDLAYHEEICQRLYGVDMGRDGALNEGWYLPLFASSLNNIIFTNGSNDPWSTLSVTVNTPYQNAGHELLMMEGAAHCNDLKLLTSLPSVTEAHLSIETRLKDWIEN